MSRKRPVPHSLKLKHRYAKTAVSLIGKLAINHQLKASQYSLDELGKVWTTWCKDGSRVRYQLAEHARLTTLQNGVLEITTTQASLATVLKHQTSSMLAEFHTQGFDYIHRIRVRMDTSSRAGKTNLSLLKSQRSSKFSSSKPSSEALRRRSQRPGKNAIAAIKSAAQNSNDESLANALDRLAQTLERQ
jgi:Protein of unknown function (DUF721).